MSIAQHIACAMTALGLVCSPFAYAQQWPAKQPIRVIVPYPAGGNADAAVRALGEAIGGPLQQTIIVDNRPGASTIIGTEAVARAAPDGYTIGVVSDSHAINQAMAKLPEAAGILGAKVPYDAVRDFVPVSGTIQIPLVLVVNPKVPAKTIQELVALSKSQAAGLNFGSMGSGSPWAIHMHQLNEATGSVLFDVPYKGLAPAANDLLGGQIDAMLMPIHYAQQYIKTGKLRPIATLGAQRHPLLPDVPTLVESGYPSLNISNYIFFIAPAGTPAAIVEQLGQTLNAALSTPAMQAKLNTSGDPYLAEPAELSERLQRDIDTYGKLIQNTLK